MTDRQLSPNYRLVEQINQLKQRVFDLEMKLRSNEVDITDTRNVNETQDPAYLEYLQTNLDDENFFLIDGSRAMTGDLDLGGNGFQTTNDLLTETELENIHDRLADLDQDLNTTDNVTFAQLTITNAGAGADPVINSNNANKILTMATGIEIKTGDDVVIKDSDDSDVVLFDLDTTARTMTIGASADLVGSRFYGPVEISNSATDTDRMRLTTDASAGYIDINSGLSQIDFRIYTASPYSGTPGIPFSLGNNTIGFYGTTPTAQSSAYTPTNVSTDRAYDANSTTIAELADVLGTLIGDLQSTGLIG